MINLLFLITSIGITLPMNQSGFTDHIQNIKELYQTSKQTIDDCMNSDDPAYECTWYSNTHIVNSMSKPWRAVGNYQKETTFWYDDEPSMAEAQDLSKESVLKFISIDAISTYNQHEEYLFEDGKLVFYYYHFSYDEESTEEYRFYFNDGKLIKFAQKGSSETPTYTKYDAEQVQEQAQTLTRSFLTGF